MITPRRSLAAMLVHLGILAAICPAATPSFGGDPEADLNGIQGEWQLVAYEYDGRSATAEKLERRDGRVIFRGNRFVTKEEGRVVAEGRFKLGTGDPPRFDGSRSHGIYELDGDTLRVCTTDKDRPRPTTFSTRDQPRTRLGLFRRVGGEEAAPVEAAPGGTPDPNEEP